MCYKWAPHLRPIMKNENHRAEPFDERANEDSYFAVQEHELIEQMNR